MAAESSHGVHPRVGVWIEMLKKVNERFREIEFTPVWGCGLKYDWLDNGVEPERFTPVWGCGLKSITRLCCSAKGAFTPVWGCGLKCRSSKYME